MSSVKQSGNGIEPVFSSGDSVPTSRDVAQRLDLA